MVKWRLFLLSAMAILPTARLQASDKAPQTNSPMLKNLTNCRAIVPDTERLACFDAAARALDEAAAMRDLVVLGREDLRETRRSLFGFTLPKLPFFGGEKGSDENERIDHIDTTAASVRSLGYGKWRIVLADGAIWKTTEVVTFDPKPGSHIRIKAAALGSYLMSIDGGRVVRAERGNER